MPKVTLVQTAQVSFLPSKMISLLNPTTMKKILALSIALTVAGLSGASANGTVFKTINQTEMIYGSIGVYNLPTDGSGFVSASAWPIADLNAVFQTPDSVTFSPNTITNTGSMWYNPESGGPGSAGQKTMVSYLYASSPKSSILGQSLVFEGLVTDFSLGTNIAGFPYSLSAFVMDVAPDYSDVIAAFIPITGTGNFSVNQALLDDPLRVVQWGLVMTGPNIWATDTVQLANAGSVTVVPEPSTYALLGMAALGGLVALRLRRKA